MAEEKVVDQKVTFAMPQELHVRLKMQAVRERKTMQEILNGLTEAYLKAKENQNG